MRPNALFIRRTLYLAAVDDEGTEVREGLLGLASGAPSEVSLGALPAIYMFVAICVCVRALLFGIAIFRARILSRWAAVLLAFIEGPSRSSCRWFGTRSIG